MLAQDAATVALSDETPTSAPVAEVSLPRGAMVGRYVVTDRLGQGGMGVVYAAYDPELERKVALKLIRTDRRIVADTEARTRLLLEARALAALSHANVVTIYDVETVDGRIVLAMEFVDGVTLQAWLEQRKRQWREIVAVFVDAGRGLAAAHTAGIVHRDFKPSNVLIGSSVKVLDFGLAQAMHAAVSEPGTSAMVGSDSGSSRSTDRMTRPGHVMGTPLYMSPEQRAGKSLDARSDQYSFCVALWHALAGTKDEIDLAKDPWSAPAFLRQALERGLRQRPDDRFASMDDLLAALDRDPARMVRRALAAAIGGSALLFAGVGLGLVVPTQPEPCGGGEAKWDAVWSEERREQADEAFAAVADGYADQAWVRTAALLDAYRDEWVAAFDDACLATKVRSEQSEAMLDREMACLELRRREAIALTDLLVTADVTTVRNAVTAARGLPPIAECEQLDPAGTDLFADPSLTPALERLADANALLAAGRYREGLELANALENPDYEPLRAEVLYAVGRGLARLERFDDAIARLEQAEFTARGSGHDQLSAAIINELVYLLAYKLERNADALAWGKHGLAAARRAADPDAARGRLLNSIGNAQQNEADYEQALQTYEEARTLLTDSLGADSPDVARAWNNAANAQYLLGRIDDAEQSYETAAKIWSDALGEDHPDAVIPFANLAGIRGRAGRYDEAMQLSRRVLEVWTRAYGSEHSQLTIPLSGLAEDSRQLGEYEAAIAYDEQALAILEKTLGPEHASTSTAVYGLGMSHYFLGHFEQAKRYFQRVVDIRERAHGPDDERLALPLCKLALCEIEIGDPEQALAYAKRALEIGERTHAPEHPGLARFHYTIATVLIADERWEDAIPHLQQTIALRPGPTVYHPDEVAGPKFDLARAYRALNRNPDEALALATEAAAAYEAWGDDEIEEAKEIRAWISAR